MSKFDQNPANYPQISGLAESHRGANLPSVHVRYIFKSLQKQEMLRQHLDFIGAQMISTCKFGPQRQPQISDLFRTTLS
jgi:hypothetical protein